jgi:integrase
MSTPGGYRATGPEFWLPLLGLFTGARLGELAQLEIADIRQSDGIDYIAITNEGVDPEKSIKSNAGRRSVPIHSRLIELGFLDYIEAARRCGSGRLFPSLKRNPKGQFANASRDFSKYISAVNIPVVAGEKKPTFHCLRHSFIDELRKKYGESDIQPLVGHEAKTVTRGYGVRETFDLEVRKKMVEAVEYPGISFTKMQAN